MNAHKSRVSAAIFGLALLTGTAVVPGSVTHAQETTPIEPPGNTQILALKRQNQQASLVKFYRYYNRGTGDHFYTTNINELGPNGRSGYRSEGIAGYVFP